MLRRVLLLAITFIPIACELTSTTITQPDDVLLVEAYVVARGPDSDPFQPDDGVLGMVFVHRVIGSPQATANPPDATITITPDGGTATVLTEQDVSACVQPSFTEGLPNQTLGRCYVADLTGVAPPGTRVELRVETVDGRVITGASTVPQDFDIVTPVAAGQSCQLPQDTRLDIAWSVSVGAWAYPSEVRFDGLVERLAQLDPDFANLDDPLVIFGLAISDSDTTISFPNEFGLFDRFGDDLLLRALIEVQDGLPAGTRSHITIAAADRNYVNWARGGSFNPSGQVRVPSVGGDGFGVFGSMVLKSIDIEVGEAGRPSCTGVATAP